MDEVHYPEDVALRSAAVREIGGIAGLGVTTLRSCALDSYVRYFRCESQFSNSRRPFNYR
jgi:hypothetical protein